MSTRKAAVMEILSVWGTNMEINLIIVGIVACVCIICAGMCVMVLHKENNALRKDNQDLLNRLMAKNYAEYAQVELTKTQQEADIERERVVIPASRMVEQDIYPVN